MLLNVKKNAALVSKNLREYVNDKKWMVGEYVRSALVVVPTHKKTEFLKLYEFMEDGEANERLMKMQKERQERNKELLEGKEPNTEKIIANTPEVSPNPPITTEVSKQQQHSDTKEGEHKDGTTGTEEHHDKKHRGITYMAPLLTSHNTRTVVPGTAQELTSDNESVLFQVELLTRGYEWFKIICREQGFMVRDFSFDLNEEKR